MLQGHILLKASQSHAKGGNIDLEAGSSQHMGAGDINLKSGTGSSDEMGGNINIVASTTTRKQRNYSYNYYDLDTSISQAKEINFGFDEVFEDSTTLRQISPQLKKLTNSTRLVSTVPFHVTTVQCESLSFYPRRINLRSINVSNHSPLQTYLMKESKRKSLL